MTNSGCEVGKRWREGGGGGGGEREREGADKMEGRRKKEGGREGRWISRGVTDLKLCSQSVCYYSAIFNCYSAVCF